MNSCLSIFSSLLGSFINASMAPMLNPNLLTFIIQICLDYTQQNRHTDTLDTGYIYNTDASVYVQCLFLALIMPIHVIRASRSYKDYPIFSVSNFVSNFNVFIWNDNKQIIIISQTKMEFFVSKLHLERLQLIWRKLFWIMTRLTPVMKWNCCFRSTVCF